MAQGVGDFAPVILSRVCINPRHVIPENELDMENLGFVQFRFDRKESMRNV
jgi:hypothetical protein